MNRLTESELGRIAYYMLDPDKNSAFLEPYEDTSIAIGFTMHYGSVKAALPNTMRKSFGLLGEEYVCGSDKDYEKLKQELVERGFTEEPLGQSSE